MKNPFLSYHFVCKSCSEESKADIVFSSKRRFLSDPLNARTNLRCFKCGASDIYHVNRVYAKPKLVMIVLIWVLAIFGSIVLGGYMWDTYYRDDIGMFDKSISVIFIGAISPLALGGFVVLHLSKAGSSFNSRISE